MSSTIITSCLVIFGLALLLEPTYGEVGEITWCAFKNGLKYAYTCSTVGKKKRSDNEFSIDKRSLIGLRFQGHMCCKGPRECTPATVRAVLVKYCYDKPKRIGNYNPVTKVFTPHTTG